MNLAGRIFLILAAALLLVSLFTVYRRHAQRAQQEREANYERALSSYSRMRLAKRWKAIFMLAGSNTNRCVVLTNGPPLQTSSESERKRRPGIAASKTSISLFNLRRLNRTNQSEPMVQIRLGGSAFFGGCKAAYSLRSSAMKGGFRGPAGIAGPRNDG